MSPYIYEQMKKSNQMSRFNAYNHAKLIQDDIRTLFAKHHIADDEYDRPLADSEFQLHYPSGDYDDWDDEAYRLSQLRDSVLDKIAIKKAVIADRTRKVRATKRVVREISTLIPKPAYIRNLENYMVVHQPDFEPSPDVASPIATWKGLRGVLEAARRALLARVQFIPKPASIRNLETYIEANRRHYIRIPDVPRTRAEWSDIKTVLKEGKADIIAANRIARAVARSAAIGEKVTEKPAYISTLEDRIASKDPLFVPFPDAMPNKVKFWHEHRDDLRALNRVTHKPVPTDDEVAERVKLRRIRRRIAMAAPEHVRAKKILKRLRIVNEELKFIKQETTLSKEAAVTPLLDDIAAIYGNPRSEVDDEMKTFLLYEDVVLEKRHAAARGEKTTVQLGTKEADPYDIKDGEELLDDGTNPFHDRIFGSPEMHYLNCGDNTSNAAQRKVYFYHIRELLHPHSVAILEYVSRSLVGMRSPMTERFFNFDTCIFRFPPLTIGDALVLGIIRVKTLATYECISILMPNYTFKELTVISKHYDEIMSGNVDSLIHFMRNDKTYTGLISEMRSAAGFLRMANIPLQFKIRILYIHKVVTDEKGSDAVVEEDVDVQDAQAEYDYPEYCSGSNDPAVIEAFREQALSKIKTAKAAASKRFATSAAASSRISKIYKLINKSFSSLASSPISTYADEPSLAQSVDEPSMELAVPSNFASNPFNMGSTLSTVEDEDKESPESVITSSEGVFGALHKIISIDSKIYGKIISDDLATRKDGEDSLVKVIMESFVSGPRHMSIVTGYETIMVPPKNAEGTAFVGQIANPHFVRRLLASLRAYQAYPNKSYQAMTACSVTKNKLCIYQTYYYLYRDHTPLIANKWKDAFTAEPIDLQTLVREGRLYDFCITQSTALKLPFYIQFFKPLTIPNANGKIRTSKVIYAVKILGAILTEITNVSLLDRASLDIAGVFGVFLFDGDHVAPRRNDITMTEGINNNIKWNIARDEDGDPLFDGSGKAIMKATLPKSISQLYTNNNNKRIKQFILKPCKPAKAQIKYVCAFDFETCTVDALGSQKPYCCCISNPKKIADVELYADEGKDVVEDLCDYIDSIATETHVTKTNSKTSVPQIMMYGFNNSRFDNIFIFKALYKRNKGMTYIIHNGYKVIRYHNVRIYDINLYYALPLEKVAKAFKLNQAKGVFPYKFATPATMNYIGPVPDVVYWRSAADRNEYIAKEGDLFDMRSYTIKYCMLDSKLTRQIALGHLASCVGVINDKHFDVSMCPTGASIALKLYSQVFLEEPIYASPPEVQVIERDAYKGGRTEVFKGRFRSMIENGEPTTFLSDLDINSSYPSSMLDKMPIRYIKTVKCEPCIMKIFTNYFIYKAKSDYIGTDKLIIPNLLIKSNKGDIIALKHTDYAYHWGCELNRAVEAGFEITVNEILEYEGEAIFADFATYLYNKRLSYKNSKDPEYNPAKSEFTKLCMNSLYGKWGQKTMTNCKICSSGGEMDTILMDVNVSLNDWEIVDDGSNGGTAMILVKYSTPDDCMAIGSCVRFSSCISAYSRCKLADMMRILGYENVHYCDTDSIFGSNVPAKIVDPLRPTDAAGNEINLLDQNILGRWKLEENADTHLPLQLTSANFFAPKTYDTVDRSGDLTVRCKGIPRAALKKEYYDNIADGLKAAEKIMNKSMFIRTLDGVRIIEQSRTMQRVCNKRIWNNEANETYAYENYNEWHVAKYGH